MSRDTISQYPRLELYFERRRKRLYDSLFKPSLVSDPNRNLISFFSRGSLLREVCIVILLAKYRGPYLANPDKPIEFNERVDRLSWLKAFGTAFRKETNKETFRECFGDVDFITANRGGGHNRARPSETETSFGWAKYHPKKLPLHNVHIYITDGFQKTGKVVEASEEELAALAISMEKSGIRKGEKRWRMMVKDMIFDLDKEKPPREGSPKRATPAVVTRVRPSNESFYSFFADYEKMVDEILVRIKKQKSKGLWYYFGPGLSKQPSFQSKRIRIFRAITREVVRLKSHAYLYCHTDTTMYCYYKMRSYVDPKKFSADPKFFAARVFFHGLHTQTSDDDTSALLFVPWGYQPGEPLNTVPNGTWLAIETALYRPVGEPARGANEHFIFSGSNNLLDAYFRALMKIAVDSKKRRIDTSQWPAHPGTFYLKKEGFFDPTRS